MRVLLVMHGWLPDTPRPVSGGAIRAWHHGEALKKAGHEVFYLTRTQDKVKGGPKVFASPRSLQAQVRKINPDRICCVQPEEAPHLAGMGIPLCVDFYAPRILEAAYEPGNAAEVAAVQTLRALSASDFQLFSNPRQRWYFLSLMSLAGIDVTKNTSAVVPLVAPTGPRRRASKAPILVMGGVNWPWQDATLALDKTVRYFEKRGSGKVLVFGGKPTLGDTVVPSLKDEIPPGKHLEYRAAVPWPELLKAYAGATAALDVMAPNSERELALSFRHVDYLGCGLPLITSTHHALSESIQRDSAGWLVNGESKGLEKALAQLFDSPKLAIEYGRNAKQLAKTQFSREACESALVQWVEEATVREKNRELIPERADLAAEVAGLKAGLNGAKALQAKTEKELGIKRDEVVQLHGQVNALTSIADRLSKAMDEVAGFKREAIAVLGAEKEAKSAESSLLNREVAELSADLAKKKAESKATSRERDRLATDLEDARDNAKHLQGRLATTAEKGAKQRAEADRLCAELDAVRSERDRYQSENESLKARCDSIQAEVSKKGTELAEANSELHRVHDKAGRFESELDRVNRELAAARTENDRLSKRRLF
jgi:predicted  nucleic acid-binding Zn-ribbon protein